MNRQFKDTGRNMDMDDGSLLYACHINDMSLIRERIKGAKQKQLKQRHDNIGLPLHAAAVNENYEAVELLLAQGTDLSWRNLVDNNAMLHCVVNGKLRMAKYLIERGTDVNAQGSHRYTALHYLMFRTSWNKDFAEYLLQKGADINSFAWDKEQPIMTAAGYGCMEGLQFLLDHGANTDRLPLACGWALSAGRTEIARFLFERGVTPEEIIAQGQGIEKGCIHRAATSFGVWKENSPMVELLCQYVDVKKAPKRQIMIMGEATKLSPLDYAKELFAQNPQYTYLQKHIEVMEQNCAR